MVQQLKRVLGRADARALALLALLILATTIGLTVAQLVKADDDSHSVATWDELIKRYLIFREDSYPLVVPSWYLAADQVEAVWKKEGFEGFQNQADWYFTFNAGALTFPTKSELAEQVKSGTRLVIYEDMTKGELLICSLPEKDGVEPKEEIVFKTLPWPEIEKGDATSRYLARELSKRRIVWEVTLKDEAQAQAEAEAAALAAPEDEGGGMMRMMSGGTCSEITFSAIELSTNSVDVGLCVPDGIANVDIFASTNLMPDGFPWVMVATNLLVTTNSVVWSWSNLEETNVFLAAGDANQDTDGDGLTDAREFYLYGTLMNVADTDGDGLSDGWEIAVGLNPRSSAGVDGASGDPDEDGLTNYEEWTLEADPLQFDIVILLGPNDLDAGGMLRLFGPGRGVEYRSLATVRSKCGFGEFTNEQYLASNPPKIYRRKTSTVDFSFVDTWYVWELNASASKAETTLYDLITCQPTQFCEGVASEHGFWTDAWLQTDKEGGWGSDCVFTGVWTDVHPPPYECIDGPCGVVTNEWDDPLTVGSWGLGNSWLECAHNFPGDTKVQKPTISGSCTEGITLSDEYTTSLLLSTGVADLYRCDSLTTIPWGEGRTWDGACGTNSAARAALRDLGTNEMQIALTKIGYRFRATDLVPGHIYRLNWMECFTPEGIATTIVLQTHTATFRGTGGTQYVENASYVIEPPATDGVIEPVVWRLQIAEPDGLPVQKVSSPDQQFRSTGPWCFEWQYVHPANVVVPYTQTIQGIVEPNDDDPFGYNWSVNAGTLTGTNTATPTFSASSMSIPSTMTTVDLKLRALKDTNTPLNAHRTLEVYRDHLERDYQNFGTGVKCGDLSSNYSWSFHRYGKTIAMPQGWNCFGSVWHAYNGTGDGFALNIPSSGFLVETYVEPINWTAALSGLQRGDIVAFYNGETLQHAHTCLGNSSQMYGANNRPMLAVAFPAPPGTSPGEKITGTWHWDVCSSQVYYERINRDFSSYRPGKPQFLNKIKVFKKQ